MTGRIEIDVQDPDDPFGDGDNEEAMILVLKSLYEDDSRCGLPVRKSSRMRQDLQICLVADKYGVPDLVERMIEAVESWSKTQPGRYAAKFEAASLPDFCDGLSLLAKLIYQHPIVESDRLRSAILRFFTHEKLRLLDHECYRKAVADVSGMSEDLLAIAGPALYRQEEAAATTVARKRRRTAEG